LKFRSAELTLLPARRKVCGAIFALAGAPRKPRALVCTWRYPQLPRAALSLRLGGGPVFRLGGSLRGDVICELRALDFAFSQVAHTSRHLRSVGPDGSNK
jgi:hypothetical protein